MYLLYMHVSYMYVSYMDVLYMHVSYMCISYMHVHTCMFTGLVFGHVLYVQNVNQVYQRGHAEPLCPY